MIRIEPSNHGCSPMKSTLFSQLGLPALSDVARMGLGEKSYISLSGLLQVCAYLYETGAVLGRARQDKFLELVSISFTPEEIQDCLAELQGLLMRRLETSGRYAHSLYTFYLYGTMRDMDMDFNVSAMKKAHGSVRDRAEVGDFLEYAGAEGLLLGSWYPDLAEKMYGKKYAAQEDVIGEMTRAGAVMPEETAITSIVKREQVVLGKVRTYVFQYYPELADSLRLREVE